MAALGQLARADDVGMMYGPAGAQTTYADIGAGLLTPGQ
jgi:hypothetical protein